jgi:hypothetical protein
MATFEQQERKKKERSQLLEMLQKGYDPDFIKFATYATGGEVGAVEKELNTLSGLGYGETPEQVEVGGVGFDASNLSITEALALEKRGEERAVVETKAQESKALAQTALDDFNVKLSQLETAIQDKSGLKSAVGTFIGGRLPTPISGNKQRFLGAVDQIVSTEALDSLIEAKGKGATFGALSEGEMKILKSAATKFGTWEVRDKDGNITGYNAKEEDFLKELNNIKTLTEKAKGKLAPAVEAVAEVAEAPTAPEQAKPAYVIRGERMTDVQANEWALANPNDPLSGKVTAKLQQEGFAAEAVETPEVEAAAPEITPEKTPGIAQDFSSTPDEETLISRLRSTYDKAGLRQDQITNATARGEQSLAEGVMQSMANGVQSILNAGGDVFVEALDLATSDDYVNQKLMQFTESSAGKEFLEFASETGKDIEFFIEENPRAARNLAVPLTLLELATIGGGSTAAKTTVKGTVATTKNMLKTAGAVVGGAAEKAPQLTSKAGQVIKKVKDSPIFSLGKNRVKDYDSAVKSVERNLQNLVEDKKVLTNALSKNSTNVNATIAERYADKIDINLDTKKLVTGGAQAAADQDIRRYSDALATLFRETDETVGKVSTADIIARIQKTIDSPSAKTDYVNAGGKGGSFQKSLTKSYQNLMEQYPDGMTRGELWELRKGIDKAVNSMADTNAAKRMRTITRQELQKQLLENTPQEIRGSVEAGFKELQTVIEARDFLKTLDAQAIVGGRMTDIIRNSASSQVGGVIGAAAGGTAGFVANPLLGVGSAVAGYAASVKIGRYFARRSIVTPKARALLKAHVKKNPQFMKDIEAYTKTTKDTTLKTSIKEALGQIKEGVQSIKPGMTIENVVQGLSKAEVDDVTRVLKDIGYDGFGGMDKDQFIGHFSEANRELYEKIIKRDKTIFDRVYRNAASLVGDNIKRDFSTPAVGKTALATEAKKYKTADEFVKGQGEIFHRTDREFKDFDSSINPDEFGTWFSTTKELSEESKDTLPILMKRFVDKKIKLITENKLSKLENTDEYLDYTGTMGDFLLKKGYEGVDYLDGSIQLVRPNKITQTRSQLTDIWNKANNKKQRKAIRDLK